MRSMIREIASTTMIVCLAATAVQAAPVVQANDSVVSNAIIHRAGLQVEWSTHSGTGTRGKIVDWHLYVDENKPTTYYTITAGELKEKFSENKLNPFGKPYSQDESYGVAEYIDVRKMVLAKELEYLGEEKPTIKVDQYSLPESTIYLLTNNGAVSAIDADTGRVKWRNQVGDPLLKSVGVGADNAHVAVINGSRLYCLKADNGKLMFSGQCRHAVAAAPTISEEKIYVPLVNGRLEVFKIGDRGVNTTSFAALGASTSRPLVTEKTVSWSTDRGLMNVAAKYDGKSVAYQLRADDAIVARPVHQSGMFYVTSLDGFVYAVDEDQGSVKWQVSTGAGISQSAQVFGGFVYVVNDNNELFKLDVKNGATAPGWEQPQQNIGQIVGAGKKDIFVLDKIGNLKALNQNSGSVLSSVSFGSVDRILSNAQSDRLFVANRQGMIQCIREVSSPVPFFHSGDFGAVAVDMKKASGGVDAGEKPMEDAGGDLEDPFKAGGALDDPFASTPKAEPAAPAKTEDDPFGGSDLEDDPFK